MSILVSAYSCCPNKGSELGNGWNWSIELAKKGEQVFCYTRSVFKEQILNELSTIELENLHFIFIDPPQYFERNYFSSKIGLYSHYIVWQWYAYLTAKRMKPIHEYSVVHHVTFASLQLGSFMFKLGLPFIFGPVGGGQFALKEFREYFDKYWKMEIMRRLTSKLLFLVNPGTKGTLRNAQTVLVSNKETEELARKMGAKNITLFLDTGLPLSFFPRKKPALKIGDTFKLLWVGRLLPRKGLKLVLDAVSSLKLDVNFHLTIVGDGEMGINIPNWLKVLDLVGNVTWLGQIAYEEVKCHYAEANLFIFTSLRDSCPAQLLEAMAFGLPVITLDMHGASLAVPDHAGIKVRPTTPHETIEEIRKAIRFLSTNIDVLEQMSANAYQYALQQTWEKKVKYVYNNFYPKLHNN